MPFQNDLFCYDPLGHFMGSLDLAWGWFQVRWAFFSAHTAADSCVRAFGCIHFEMDHELGIPELYLREKGEDVCLQLPW